MHKLAEFLTSDSLTAQGYFEFEGFTGHLPAQARARLPGLGADLRRLQHEVLVLHRAVDPRAQVDRPLDELVDEVRATGRRRRREVTLLGQNVNAYGARLRAGERSSFAELLHAR